MFNTSSNLYGSEWLALVFSNRNKSYGAYVLRSQSANMMVKAFLIVIPVFVLFFVGPYLYGYFNPVKTATDVMTQVDIAPDVIHELPKKKVEKPKAAKAAPIKQAAVKTIKMPSQIKVVNEPITDTPPPTTAAIKDAVIGSVTQDGVIGNNSQAVGTSDGVGGSGASEVSGTAVYEATEIDAYPEYPGGMAAWAKFIQRNLRYPYRAQEENIQGKVYVSFVVEKDGSITDVKVVKGIGYGCDEEAQRVIEKSPKWKAGKQNNQFVRVRYQMPIGYVLSQ